MLRLLRSQPVRRSVFSRATTTTRASRCSSFQQFDDSSNGTPQRCYSHSAPVHSLNNQIPKYEGLPDDAAKVIHEHAQQPQTPVSLQALMRTGKGEYLHKHFEDASDVDQHSATELVLIQV
jgi:hypothetical protein